MEVLHGLVAYDPEYDVFYSLTNFCHSKEQDGSQGITFTCIEQGYKRITKLL
jgi:hypothetical protein